MKQVPYEKVLEKAKSYEKDMTKFLRDMIAIPSESCKERDVIQRIKQEAEKIGFDEIKIDAMGNFIGILGKGKHVIALDAHIDTVGIGNKDNWTFDPYKGYENDEEIGGRGASDQEGGMASMMYAAKIIKDLDLLDDYKLILTGTVQEEDCDGLCWQYLIKENVIPRPEFVISTEPTDGGIYRGQRGRMEIRVEVAGISCHGSAPERGDNAIFKMGEILGEVKELSTKLKDDPFLGKGTLTVSEIFFTSPSRCAVADSCAISIDRRLTWGENGPSSIKEIEDLPSVKKYNAKVTMYKYDSPAYTGLVYPTDCYFPTWVIDKDHVVCKTLMHTYKQLFKKDGRLDKWTFSTNGVAIMGMHDIPCIGFGPGKEKEAHFPNEKTWKKDLIDCAAMYAAVPLDYLANIEK